MEEVGGSTWARNKFSKLSRLIFSLSYLGFTFLVINSLLAHMPFKKCLLSQQNIKTTWNAASPKCYWQTCFRDPLYSACTSKQLGEAGSGQCKGIGYPGRQSLVTSQNPKVSLSQPFSQPPLINHVSEWWHAVRVQLLPCKDRSRHLELQIKFVFWCHSFSLLAGMRSSWVLTDLLFLAFYI